MSVVGWLIGRRRATSEPNAGVSPKGDRQQANNGALTIPPANGSQASEENETTGIAATTTSGSSLQTPPSTTAAGASAAVAVGATASTGLTGAGVKIGIISDSFNALGTAAADEADGALPSHVQVLQDNASGRDEGRAMAEVAHGVASGADIVFSAADGTVAGLAASVAALQAAGCQVICDDVTYTQEPFFQMGDPIEKAISAFTSAGGVYVTAASNAGPDSAYAATFAGTAATLPGVGAVTAMNFGTATAPKTVDVLNLTAGRPTALDLQWAQPWASIDGTGSTYSLALAVYDPSGTLVKTVAGNQVGGDPVQSCCFTPAVTGAYTVAVYVNGGTDPGGTFKVVANNNASMAAAFAGSRGSGSVIGHNMDPQAISVGAVAAADTPAYGGTPKSEAFSASGADQQLYSDTGAALTTPKTLHAVDVSGPDGVATTLPSSDLSPFYGTSCATPAVAAVAALMKQANPSLDAGEVKAMLKSTALAFGTAAQAGAGLVQAPGAVALAEESNTAIHDDFFGKGQSALLWQNGSGGVAVSEVSDDQVLGTATLSTPAGAGWSAVATGDFSGSAGRSDILWRNADGRLDVVAMSGATVTSQTSVGDPGAQWTVVGTGDFNGDGQSDILLGDKAGDVDLLTMKGADVASRTIIDGPGAGWTAAGVGDFNGDGRSDILWRNASGALAAWIMNGSSVASELQLATAPGADWSVAGTGDLTGDGKADILLQNAATGALDLWAMSGGGVTSQTAVSGTPGTGWHAAGVGAFNAGGHDGILFEDAATGGAMFADVSHGQINRTATIATPGAGWSATLA